MRPSIKPLQHLGGNKFVLNYADYRNILSEDVNSYVYIFAWHDKTTRTIMVDFKSEIPSYIDKTFLDPKYAPDKEEEWV